MMYYGGTGGAGGVGWILMGLSMVAFWAVVISLVVWALRSYGRATAVKPAHTVALSILQERFAKGEITREQYTGDTALIQGGT